MTIDGQKIELYGAKLVDYTIGPTQFTLDNFSYGVINHLFSSNEGRKELKVTLEIFAENQHKAQINLSLTTAALQGQHLLRLGDDFLYDTILTSIAEPERLTPNRFYIEYIFDTISCGEMETITFAKDVTFYCKSTAIETPCIIILKPVANISALSILNIALENIHAGENWYIDGIHKTVSCNGQNAFNQMASYDFPCLSAGMQDLNLSSPVSGKILYYPIFI